MTTPAQRKVMRIFCSKRKGAHEIGAIWADEHGFELRITHAARDVDGFLPVEITYRPGTEMDYGTFAWCPSCRMRLVCLPEQLIADAKRGTTHVALLPEGFIRDPLGVLTRRDARRHR